MQMHRLVTAVTVSLAVTLAGLAAVPGAAAKTFVYVSAATDGKVDAYSMDEATGVLTPLANVEAGKSVMPMAVSPDKAHLYAVVRSQPYRVLTYSIDPSSGALAEEAVAALPDSMPYVSTEKSGRLLFFASYGGNKIASLPVGADGLVKDGVKQLIPTGRNAHAIVSDKTGTYVFVPNLGSDAVLQFVFNAETGMLEPNDPPMVKTKAGQGPRHIVISPDNKSAYVVTELTGEVIHYTLDPAEGTLTERGTASFVPPGANLEPGVTPPPPPAFNAPPRPAAAAAPAAAPTPKVWAADIGITPNGKFLYATERTTSTIALFTVAPDSGALTYVTSVPTEKQPRGIRIDPTGRFLIASGEKSDKLSVYAIDEDKGALSEVGRYSVDAGANWIEIVNLP
jgi:6-phosphogluconolactonase